MSIRLLVASVCVASLASSCAVRVRGSRRPASSPPPSSASSGGAVAETPPPARRRGDRGANAQIRDDRRELRDDKRDLAALQHAHRDLVIALRTVDVPAVRRIDGSVKNLLMAELREGNQEMGEANKERRQARREAKRSGTLDDRADRRDDRRDVRDEGRQNSKRVTLVRRYLALIEQPINKPEVRERMEIMGRLAGIERAEIQDGREEIREDKRERREDKRNRRRR